MIGKDADRGFKYWHVRALDVKLNTVVERLAGFLLACSGALALNPALDISQYAHTAWRVREGFGKGAIQGIAQTPDGYLWLGTEFGLLRFDGVRATTWQPPPGEELRSTNIYSLLVTRDGRLWIGTVAGLASWKDGRLTQYPELAGQAVGTLFEGNHGTVWAGGTGATNGRLCAIQNGSVRCDGDDGVFSRVDSGTELELTVPAPVAYRKSPRARRWMFWGREKA